MQFLHYQLVTCNKLYLLFQPFVQMITGLHTISTVVQRNLVNNWGTFCKKQSAVSRENAVFIVVRFFAAPYIRSNQHCIYGQLQGLTRIP